MLRKYAKVGVARGLSWTGADKYLGTLRSTKALPLVMCYHRVVTSYSESTNHSINAQLVSTVTFERQLDWIAQCYDFVTLDELARMYIEGNGSLRNKGNRPVAAITFDDGYADVYQNAIPILARKGIPSAVFVVTDTIGTAKLHLHDELYLRLARFLVADDIGGSRKAADLVDHLQLDPEAARRLGKLLENVEEPFSATRICIEKLSRSELESALKVLRSWTELSHTALRGLGSMSWEMLKEMIGQGVTVGSHTKSHLLLAGEATDKVRQQVVESRSILEEKLGVPIHYLAYPDGSFDVAVAKATEEAGYLCAFTTCSHSDSRYPLLTIPRRVFWEHTCSDSVGQFSPAILSCQVNGIFDPARRCQRPHA